MKTGGSDGTCQSKWSRMKKDYVQVKSLLDMSGFGWDEELFLPVAEDAVWEEIEKVLYSIYSLVLGLQYLEPP